uniref:BTB_2 domain-containing protein n=1 Tax=Meloidogyne hapla TaxID=6305 RepID=A0A1I8B2S9_MELHA
MGNNNNSSRIVFNVGDEYELVGNSPIEIFIDRDGSRFEYVLNYLRNGYIANADNDGDELFEMLEKEAQYFGISEMANLCRSMQEPLAVKACVRWRKDAIPHYWKLFLKCVIDRSLSIPFTYERNSFFYAKCIACEADFDPKCSNIYSFSVDDWSALGHHMGQMCGRVEKLIGQTCVLVKWDNGVVTHLPNSALKRAIPIGGGRMVLATQKTIGGGGSIDK